MLVKIKNRIERELRRYAGNLNKSYSLKKISPLLTSHIKEFLLRKGKRIRPCLFVIGYLGFSKKPAAGLYTSALSLELLHDFFLVHDDIIDKSQTRRGKPSMHAGLNTYLRPFKNRKFNGQDLAIVAGDCLYALALDAFLSIKENAQRKESALKKLIETTLYTASGEFLEVLTGIKDIDKVSKTDIYKIYDLKTASYTFASPLAIGATLAGAKKEESGKLFKYGMYLGRAFQIRDDILGMFSEELETGKPNLSDLREAKKTLLIWHAYNRQRKNRPIIKNILSKPDARQSDLLTMRKIVTESGSLAYAKKEILCLQNKAETLLAASGIKSEYKRLLREFSQKILG